MRPAAWQAPSAHSSSPVATPLRSRAPPQDLSNRQAAELERLRALFQEEASAFAAAWGAQAEEMAAAALAAQQGLMERQLNELADMKVWRRCFWERGRL